MVFPSLYHHMEAAVSAKFQHVWFPPAMSVKKVLSKASTNTFHNQPKIVNIYKHSFVIVYNLLTRLALQK